MDVTEYRQDFLDQVRARASADANFTRAEFVEICAEHLSDAEELADFEACYHRGKGRATVSSKSMGSPKMRWTGRYAWCWRSMVAERNRRRSRRQPQGRLFSKLLTFCEDAFSGRLVQGMEESAPGYSLAQLLFERRKAITRVRLYVVTDGVLSTRVKDWPEGEVGGIPTESHIWDINRFHQVYESKSGRDDLEVDFTTVVRGGLPCLSASVPSEEYRAYLCVIPGNVLADIYDQFGSRLLEGNVRSFLGTPWADQQGDSQDRRDRAHDVLRIQQRDRRDCCRSLGGRRNGRTAPDTCDGSPNRQWRADDRDTCCCAQGQG